MGHGQTVGVFARFAASLSLNRPPIHWSEMDDVHMELPADG